MVLSLLFHLIADCVTLGVFTPKLIRSVALAPSYRRQHLHRWLFSWWPDLCRAVCNADVAWFATAGLLCFLQRSGKTRIARCVKGCGLHSMIRNCHQVKPMSPRASDIPDINHDTCASGSCNRGELLRLSILHWYGSSEAANINEAM